jgi:hypothetical protein
LVLEAFDKLAESPGFRDEVSKQGAAMEDTDKLFN